MNWLEYVRRDTEGSDSDTRRRAASELVKTLTDRFPQQARCVACLLLCCIRVCCGGSALRLAVLGGSCCSGQRCRGIAANQPAPPSTASQRNAGHGAVQRVRGRHAGRVRRRPSHRLEGQGLRRLPRHRARRARQDGGRGCVLLLCRAWPAAAAMPEASQERQLRPLSCHPRTPLSLFPSPCCRRHRHQRAGQPAGLLRAAGCARPAGGRGGRAADPQGVCFQLQLPIRWGAGELSAALAQPPDDIPTPCSHPTLALPPPPQADALKFVTTFRSQLPKPTQLALFPSLVR